MSCAVIDKIEKLINEKIRPVLYEDDGNIEVLSFTEGVLKVRSLGRCSNCPSAVFEIEQMLMAEMQTLIPEVRSVIVVTGVSNALLETARSLMGQKSKRVNRDGFA